jgi:hypothetical protein
MQEANTVGYDDIVAMTQEEIANEDVEIDTFEDPFDQFENWAMNLGETSAISSQDQEEQAQAIKDLQDLVGQHFPAGVDGSNAISSLKGIIEDPDLFNDIKTAASQDPDTCVRPIVKDWLEANTPEVVDQLDFGDMVDDSETPATDQGGEETAPEEVPQESSDEGEEGSSNKMNVQELAEFIHSFYDRDSGTFPKGPEGVCTMVGKKFGEQAEQVARKMVERMAPQQQAPELQELSRIRELSGMPDTSVAEESGSYYYERLAQEIFDMNPNLDTSGRADEFLNAAFPLLVRDLGSKKRANNLLNYDQDFPSDLVSAYGELKRSSGSNESSTMELEAIRRLSGISQGMGF